MESGGAATRLFAAAGARAISICDELRKDGRSRLGVDRGSDCPPGSDWENVRMMRKMQIGFTQRLQLKWLDRTAGLLSAGSERSQIKAALTDLLKDHLSLEGTEGRG